MANGNNYTLGRGKVYYGTLDIGPDGAPILVNERYVGNTPGLSVTMEATNLDHYSSDYGIREKDESVIVEMNRTGSLVMDNIHPANLALFFLGTAQNITNAQRTVTGEQVGLTDVGVEKGMFYQLGVSATNPAGARGIIYPGETTTAFSLAGTGTLEVNVDYTVDPLNARIHILPDAPNITDGEVLTAGYTVAASTFSRVISGSTAREGSIRYITQNAVGTDCSYLFPRVKLTPDGEFELKSDEWLEIPMSMEILKTGDLEAVYIDGVPVTTI